MLLTDQLNFFMEALNKAGEISIPVNKPFTPSHPKKSIWWDNECDSMQKQKEAALNEYKKYATTDNFLLYKKCEAKAKKLYKSKAKNSWVQFCSSLNANTSISTVWKKAKRLKNAPVTNINVSNDIAEQILNKITPLSDFKNKYNVPPSSSNDVILNEITMEELNFAINQTHDTAPGYDQITYSMLRNMGFLAKKYLLDIFNLIWLYADVPEVLKECLVILILKPGKKPKTGKLI